MLCGGLGGREIWGRMDTYTCMAKSLCCPSKTITTLLISNIPTQNKKFKHFYFVFGHALPGSKLKIHTFTDRACSYNLTTFLFFFPPSLPHKKAILFKAQKP